MEKNKKTFWPYGILLSLVAIVIACVVTIIICLDYPVYTDDSYFDTYQNVDRNYEQIQKSQIKFEQNIKFNPNANIFVNNELYENIKEMKINRDLKSIKSVNSKDNITLAFDINSSALNADILLTRPHNSEFNSPLNSQIQNGKLITQSFSVPQSGRWQVKIKLTQNEQSTAFYQFDFFVE